MTNDMTARKSPTHRTRDWGNTPILFSLKNVQPLLVAAPPRPEGNVAAPSSVSVNDAPAPVVQAAPFSLEPEGPRVKPKPASKLAGMLKNSIALTLLILLVLLVIKISVNDSPIEKSSAQASPAPEALLGAPIPNSTPAVTPAIPTLAATPSILPTPASPTLVAAPAPTESTKSVVPETPSETAAPELATAPAVPAVNPPLLLTASNPNPPAPAPAMTGGGIVIPSSDEGIANETNATAPTFPIQQPREPAFPGTSDRGAVANPSPTTPIPATPSPTVQSAGSGLIISVHSTSTPDLPTESVIELWNRANGNPTGSQLATAKQPVPYTPVSNTSAASSTSGSYQPISTGWDFVPPTVPVTGSTSPAAAGSATPSWNSLTPAGQAASNTTLSGQPYPPKAQEYRPLTVQPNEQVAAPTPVSGTVNRYQPIRQPGATPTTTTSSPTGQPRAPYVPMGTQGMSPSASGATSSSGTSFGYPAIQ